jgi:hypothetical protein
LIAFVGYCFDRFEAELNLENILRKWKKPLGESGGFFRL